MSLDAAPYITTLLKAFDAATVVDDVAALEYPDTVPSELIR